MFHFQVNKRDGSDRLAHHFHCDGPARSLQKGFKRPDKLDVRVKTGIIRRRDSNGWVRIRQPLDNRFFGIAGFQQSQADESPLAGFRVLSVSGEIGKADCRLSTFLPKGFNDYRPHLGMVGFDSTDLPLVFQPLNPMAIFIFIRV